MIDTTATLPLQRPSRGITTRPIRSLGPFVGWPGRPVPTWTKARQCVAPLDQCTFSAVSGGRGGRLLLLPSGEGGRALGEGHRAAGDLGVSTSLGHHQPRMKHGLNTDELRQEKPGSWLPRLRTILIDPCSSRVSAVAKESFWRRYYRARPWRGHSQAPSMMMGTVLDAPLAASRPLAIVICTFPLNGLAKVIVTEELPGR
jgi:hypothetical protein